MNKLFTKIAGLSIGLAMAIGVGAVVGSKGTAKVDATEQVAYDMTIVTGGSNGYATTSTDLTCNGIKWSAVGNTTENPWRIGGKSISNTTRNVWSQSAVSSENISKVVLTVGTASNITVNSLKLLVGTSAFTASSTSGGTSTVTGTFKASSDITFNRPSGADWSNKYFAFSFDVTVSGSSNKYVQFSAAKFYYEPSTSYTVSTSTSGLTLSTASTTASGGDVTMTTAARKKGSNVQVSNTATSSVSGNVVTLSSVTGNVTINATIVDATPTLGVTGQKTLFKLDEDFSFGGTVTKTYDDWVTPHTVDSVASGNYTVDSTNFVKGVEDTYTITVSSTGCADFVYQVTVSNIEEKTDLINVDNMEASGTSYATYTFNGSSSKTAYNSQNSVNNNVNLQYRSNNSNSGLVNTNSKGIVKSVTITVASGTNTINVYGSNSAYTDPTDLYDSSKQGTLVDSTSSTKTITFEDDYAYVGLRSNSGAVYLSSVEITWLVTPKAVHHIKASEVTEPGPFYVGTKPSLGDLGVTVEAYYDQAETDHEDVTTLATIVYPANGLTDDNNGGEGYTISYGGKSTNVDIAAEIGDVYAKLTSIVDLITGSTVRVATDSEVMSSTGVTGTRLASVSGDPTNASLSDVANMTVGADKDGYYFTVEIDSATNYLTCPSDNAYLSFTTTLDAKSHWNVSIGVNGVARIFNASFTEREVRKNTNNDFFSSYKGGETAVSIYQLVDNDMTEEEKAAAQVDTFGKLFLHKLDIIDNETTRTSDGTTCNGYYDNAKDALTNAWNLIQEEFSKDDTGMWERYCSWAWVTYREIPSFSGGQIQYSRTNGGFASIVAGTNNSIVVIIVISLIGASAIGGYFLFRRRKEQ